MLDTLKQWWADLQGVFHKPLIDLGDSHLTLDSIIKLLVVLTLVFIAERILRRTLRKRVLSRTNLEPDLQYAVSRFFGYCFIVLGFFVAFKVVHLDLSSLAVIVGGLGVGIGFGLQNIISNFVSGLIILAERTITIGHRIEVGGVAGQVSKINLRSTIVITNDNISIIVPNSSLITNPVTNWSYGDPRVRMRLPIGVAYGTDLDKLQRILLEVAAETPAVLKEPPPSLLFLGYGDSSLNFELAVWTLEMANNPKRFRSNLYFAIDRKFREHNIEVPFPQRDLHLRSGNFAAQSANPGTPSDAKA